MIQTLEEYITVKRSIAECFAYLRDFATIEQWDPAVLQARKLSPGRPEVGSKYQLKLKLPGGRSTNMLYTQVSIDEQRQLILHGVGSNFSALDTISLKALDPETTEIHYRAELHLDWMPSPFAWFISPLLKRIGKNAVSGLQRALEIPTEPAPMRFKDTVADRMILPAAINFGRRGYLTQVRKSHSTRLDGKVIAITGPTAGLGLSAACELARLGASLILIGRDKSRLEQAAAEIRDFSGCPSDTLYIYNTELSSLENTAAKAKEISANHPHIDVLINNAGALFAERQITDEGLERSLALNFLAPLLLSKALNPSFSQNSRIINVVSGGLYLQGLALDDLQYSTPPFDGSKAYARAKRALLTMSQHRENQLATVHAMHPGWAATPGVAKSLPAFNKAMHRHLRDSRMGADTMVWLAAAPEISSAPSGQLWFDRRAHTDAVLPNTACSEQDRQKLRDWSDEILTKHLF
ncbi:SDR family NAD(P)-dependent oxidoreductase [Zhongshania guokunii]|uniref:SDR family NAD(P)-dependent oxidoreductase n=1 Tax=Zhongshania guokunii TaxID=641783 RepID=A0ABV3U209_9GAMM